MRTIVSLPAGVPRFGFRSSSFFALLVALLAFAGHPIAARAQSVFEPRPRHASYDSEFVNDDWREHRIFFAGGVGLPVSFPAGWRAGAGGSLGFAQGIAEYADLIVDLERYTHHFDDSKLRAQGATSIVVDGTATFGDISLGVRVHAPRFGPRLYGLFEFAMPSISRPTLWWTDAFGQHEQRGSEIFGFDFGYVLGVGFEKVEAHKFGFGVEARFVIAPGSTEPTEYLTSFRGGVSVPIPPDR